MVEIRWLTSVRHLFEELSAKEQRAIIERLDLVQSFPTMYPLRRTGLFRGHRYFLAGRWLVYYRQRGDAVYIRRPLARPDSAVKSNPRFSTTAIPS